MDEHTYQELWRYSEKFSQDRLQRSELVTMAWRQGLKLGNRCTLKLMYSIMHFRSKELKIRSAFPSDEMGKSQCDVWNCGVKMEIERPHKDKNGDNMSGEYLIPYKVTPLDHTIVVDFIDHLTENEKTLLENIYAGFSFQDIRKRMKLTYEKLKSLRRSLESKAVMCLA